MTESPVVAVMGSRWADLSIEEAVLGPRGVRLVAVDGGTPDDIVAGAAGAEVVLCGSEPRFDASVIDRLSCRGIVRYGVGVDSVDLDAAQRAGIWVAYVPDYGTEAVALHAVTLLLAGIRRLITADAIVKAGRWGFDDLRPLHEPKAMTVGIIGFGRVGRRAAELLKPFGFGLLAHDAYVDIAIHRTDVRPAGLDEILTNSDAITLHASGRPDGRPLLGRAELQRLKSGVVLVNTARGSLIDQAALLEGLHRGTPAIAALDVFEPEPPGSSFDEVADRVILSPHIAWYTEESEWDLRTKAAREALRILDGQAPLHAAVTPSGAA